MKTSLVTNDRQCNSGHVQTLMKRHIVLLMITWDICFYAEIVDICLDTPLTGSLAYNAGFFFFFFFFFFLCWVLRPSKGLCPALSVYVTTLFPGRLSSLHSICAHSLVRNWQLPFWNTGEGRESDSRKYFIIHLHQRMLLDPAGMKPVTSWSPIKYASDWAIEAAMLIQSSC